MTASRVGMHQISAAFLLILCFFITEASSEEIFRSTMRFGSITVLSGEGASWGINFQRGIMLAVGEVNSSGGINGKKVEVLFEDSPSGLAKNAVTAYSKLVSSNGIKFIFGPVAMDELLAIAPMAGRDGVFLNGATYMPNAPRNFFSTWIDADVEGDLLVNYVIDKHKRVAILGSQQSWESQVAHRFRETFTKLGGEIVAFEEPSFESIEVRSEALRARQKRPDAIVITSYLLLSKYIKELRTLGMRVPLFSIELDQSAIDASGSGAEGLIFIAPSLPSDEFATKFRQKWRANPDIPAANAYDSAKLLFQAISEHGESVNGVIEFFDGLKSYDGATGHIERRNGKTIISTTFYVVRDGKIVRLN